jgi:hypothetical protein
LSCAADCANSDFRIHELFQRSQGLSIHDARHLMGAPRNSHHGRTGAVPEAAGAPAALRDRVGGPLVSTPSARSLLNW